MQQRQVLHGHICRIKATLSDDAISKMCEMKRVPGAREKVTIENSHHYITHITFATSSYLLQFFQQQLQARFN